MSEHNPSRGELLFSGEHWLNYLRPAGSERDSAMVSIYHGRYSPAGPGTAAYVLIPGEGVAAACTDSPAFETFIRATMYRNEGPFAELPTVAAEFRRDDGWGSHPGLPTALPEGPTRAADRAEARYVGSHDSGQIAGKHDLGSIPAVEVHGGADGGDERDHARGQSAGEAASRRGGSGDNIVRKNGDDVAAPPSGGDAWTAELPGTSPETAGERSWTIATAEREVRATWSRVSAPYVGPPTLHPKIVFTVLVFCETGRIELDGRMVAGEPYPREGWAKSLGKPHSSVCFALAETMIA